MGLLDGLLHRKPPDAAADLGHNDPCWCGSGKKYKTCHHQKAPKPDDEGWVAHLSSSTESFVA